MKNRIIATCLLSFFISTVLLTLTTFTPNIEAKTINFAPNTEIQGIITDRNTNEPLEASILVYDENFNSITDTVSSAINGQYSIQGLPSGNYKVGFSKSLYARGYHSGTVQANEAITISISEGQSITVSHQLIPIASITGTVTSKIDGSPLEGVSLSVSSSIPVIIDYHHDTSDGNGEYMLRYNYLNVGPGAPNPPSNIAQVNVANFCASTYECYLAQSAEIPVENGQSFSLDIALDKSPLLTGTVRSASTGEYISATVKLYSDEKPKEVGCGPFGCSSTTPLLEEFTLDCSVDCTNGFAFVIEPDVEYYLEAVPHSSVSAFAPEFFDGKSKEEAQIFELSANATEPNIDFTLDLIGSIEGTVRDESTNEVLQNVAVSLFRENPADNSEPVLIDSTTTNGMGQFTFIGLQATEYIIKISATDPKYLDLTLDNISVASGQTTTINPKLAVGGAISGVITAKESGNPIANARIFLFDELDQSFFEAKDTYTDQAGAYEFIGLPTGTYYLYISEGGNNQYIPQYFGGAKTIESSQSLSVTIGQTAQANDSLATGGTIIFNFTDSDTSELITGIDVHLFLYQHGSPHNYLGSPSPTSNGTMVIEGLPTGEFYPWAYPSVPPSSSFEGKKYAPAEPFVTRDGVIEVYLQTSATHIFVTEGMTQSVNIPLSELAIGSVEGVATDQGSNEPQAGVEINLYQIDSTDGGRILIDNMTTDSEGKYHFENIWAGYTYIVAAEKDTSNSWSQVNHKYLDQSSSSFMLAKDSVKEVNLALTKGGRITGQIVDEATSEPLNPPPSAYIYQRDLTTDGSEEYIYLGAVGADENGNFESFGLNSGNYYVSFWQSYDREYEIHDSISSLSGFINLEEVSPTPVSVSVGQDTIVNSKLAKLADLAGSISGDGVIEGLVTSEDSEAGLSDYGMELYREVPNGKIERVLAGSTTSNLPIKFLKSANGYQFTGLPDGNYFLKVILARRKDQFGNPKDGAEYRDTWYGGTQFAEGSQKITVSNGGTVSNVDFALEKGTLLFGIFNPGTTLPFDLNTVRLHTIKFYDRDGIFLFDYDARDGWVYLQGMWPGTYHLFFTSFEHQVPGNGNSRFFNGEWYGNSSTIENSTPLVIVEGEESHKLVGATLSADNPIPILPEQPKDNDVHKVTGTITADGRPLSGVTVTSNISTERPLTVITNSRGKYTMYLKDGSHTLTPSKAGYQFSPTNRAVMISGADEAGQDFSATVLPTGSIAGTVSDSAGMLGTVDVLAYTEYGSTWQFVQKTVSEADGNYKLEELPPADYKLLFRTTAQSHKSEYYDDAKSFSQGVIVTVPSGANVTNIDASLEKRPEPTITAAGIKSYTDPETGKVTLSAGRSDNSTITIRRDISCQSGEPSDIQLIIGAKAFGMSGSGSGSYTTTLNIPADVSTESNQNMSVQYVCSGFTESVSVGKLVLFDPSGVITDAKTGEPIQGASVTLYRVAGAVPDTSKSTNDCRTVDTRPETSSGRFGAWSGVPAADLSAGHPVDAAFDTLNGQALFSPAVPTQVTDADGKYAWDVAEGCWYVVVEAEGYSTQVSPMVGVPPAVLDLDITLSKLAPPPPSSFDIYLPIIVR